MFLGVFVEKRKFLSFEYWLATCVVLCSVHNLSLNFVCSDESPSKGKKEDLPKRRRVDDHL